MGCSLSAFTISTWGTFSPDPWPLSLLGLQLRKYLDFWGAVAAHVPGIGYPCRVPLQYAQCVYAAPPRQGDCL